MKIKEVTELGVVICPDRLTGVFTNVLSARNRFLSQVALLQGMSVTELDALRQGKDEVLAAYVRTISTLDRQQQHVLSRSARICIDTAFQELPSDNPYPTYENETFLETSRT